VAASASLTLSGGATWRRLLRISGTKLWRVLELPTEPVPSPRC
jgi:hypothetical protein